MLDLYNLVISLVLFVLLGVSVYNLRRFVRLPPRPDPDPNPVRVSVLVPARNEERCIEANVRSLCQQEYANLEVVVLDDRSTDATPQILTNLCAEFPHLKVIRGEELPSGWVGKSWACHQLWRVATGDVLLFTDADTVHAPDAIARSVHFLQSQNVDLFSLVPYQVLGSFAEHVVIPMVHVLYFAYLPNDLILRNRRVSLAAANGQFMCFTRTAYERIDGHRSVRASLVEDVFLAKEVKRAGGRIALVDGTDAVSCRMYTSATEVTEGFSKNFFPATGRNLPLTAVFLLHLLTAYVVPLPMAIVGLAMGNAAIWAPAAIHLGIGALIRTLIRIRFRMPGWHALLQPITGAWAAAIGVNSIRWAYSRHGARWKGRSYTITDNDHA